MISFGQDISGRTLKILKVLMYFSVVFLLLFSVVSLGLTGSNLTVWEEIETQSYLAYLESTSKMFFTSQQLIVSFDVLMVPFSLLLLFSTFKFYTKGNLIIIVIFLSVFAGRWVMSILFLGGYSDLRTSLQTSYDLIKGNQACQQENCNSSVNYVVCGKVKMWKELYSFQIAYTVVCFLVSVGSAGVSYIVNKIDVERGEIGSDL